MNLLQQLLGIGRHQPQQQAPQLMQVNQGGKFGPSNQGYLPPSQQQDTFMSNDYSGRGPTRGGAIPMGQARAVEGYYPQHIMDEGENSLQQGGYNPQTSIHSGLQQNQGLQFGNPAMQNIQGGGSINSPGGYGAADPMGWQQVQNNPYRFRGF